MNSVRNVRQKIYTKLNNLTLTRYVRQVWYYTVHAHWTGRRVSKLQSTLEIYKISSQRQQNNERNRYFHSWSTNGNVKEFLVLCVGWLTFFDRSTAESGCSALLQVYYLITFRSNKGNLYLFRIIFPLLRYTICTEQCHVTFTVYL